MTFDDLELGHKNSVGQIHVRYNVFIVLKYFIKLGEFTVDNCRLSGVLIVIIKCQSAVTVHALPSTQSLYSAVRHVVVAAAADSDVGLFFTISYQQSRRMTAPSSAGFCHHNSAIYHTT